MPPRFVPVARRELLAAARRKGTYRFRWWAALLAIAVSFIWLGSRSAASLPGGLSSRLFALQTSGAFGLALLAGAFFAADCLSEEKRDGTLVLLFLTDLNAKDIIAGKFAALSFSAFNALLALLPVIAIPFLLGGVELAEFWRISLALANTLFFSLALGLGVSAFATRYSRGLVWMLALLAFFGAGLPALAELVVSPSSYGRWSVLAWISPFYAFISAGKLAYVVAPHKFWVALFSCHLLAWLCLGLAALRLRATWCKPDSDLQPAAPSRKWNASQSRRNQRPRKADEPFDPVLRLVGDPRLIHWVAWGIALGGGSWCFANRLWLGQAMPEQLLAKTCAFLLKTLFVFQACRFFVETRRNGALELLLCTPLRNADLITAQWRLLRRTFLWPVVIFLALAWAAVLVGTESRSLPKVTPSGFDDLQSSVNGLIFLSAGLAADSLAAGWFGMWLALTARKPSMAPGITLLLVLILPTLLYHFDLVADMLFISWGTTRFREDFRWQIDAAATESENHLDPETPYDVKGVPRFAALGCAQCFEPDSEDGTT